MDSREQRNILGQGLVPTEAVNDPLIEHLSNDKVLALASNDSALNGANGYLRAPAYDCDIMAQNDLQAVVAWLSRKKGAKSPATVRAYRREAERLIRWCWVTRYKAISDLDSTDYENYRKFLADPKPYDDWVNPKKTRRTDANWRPFQGPMTPKNINYTFTILNEMLNWMVSKGYLRRNPMSSDKDWRSKTTNDQKPTRFALTDRTWQAVIETTEALNEESRDRRLRYDHVTVHGTYMSYERARYILMLCLQMGFRVSDFANNTMGAFKSNVIRGQTYWSWEGIGKGNKVAGVPANAHVMEVVKRYRRALGCPSPLPTTEDTTGMAMSLDGKSALSGDRIYRIIVDIFRSAHAREDAKGRFSELDDHELHTLLQASTHWLRHTSITRQLESGIPLQSVQELARHSDPKTTAGYNTENFVKLHDETLKNKVEWVETDASE